MSKGVASASESPLAAVCSVPPAGHAVGATPASKSLPPPPPPLLLPLLPPLLLPLGRATAAARSSGHGRRAPGAPLARRGGPRVVARRIDELIAGSRAGSERDGARARGATVGSWSGGEAPGAPWERGRASSAESRRACGCDGASPWIVRSTPAAVLSHGTYAVRAPSVSSVSILLQWICPGPRSKTKSSCSSASATSGSASRGRRSNRASRSSTTSSARAGSPCGHRATSATSGSRPVGDAGDRHPVLSRAPAARAARAAPDDGGRRAGRPRRARSSCGTSADTPSTTRTGSRRGASWRAHLRQPRRRLRARALPAAPVQPKSFVRHLPNWYAQAHPDEDFAETFAVWLATPRRSGARAIAGWKALEKLEYVDALMREARKKPPLVTSAAAAGAPTRRSCVARSRATTRPRRKLWAEEYPGFYDADLRRIFGREPHGDTAPPRRFMRRRREAIVGVGRPLDRAAQVRRRRARPQAAAAVRRARTSTRRATRSRSRSRWARTLRRS